jgi:hypothetical protein
VKCLVVSNLISIVPPDVYILFTTALCIVVGHFAYLWVELLITRRLSGKTGKSMGAGKVKKPNPARLFDPAGLIGKR